MKALRTVSRTHPVTRKENRTKPRTALLGIVAGAMIGVAGLVPETASAADVPDPAFVDPAISAGTLNLNSARVVRA
jgi:hypothetical protein